MKKAILLIVSVVLSLQISMSKDTAHIYHPFGIGLDLAQYGPYNSLKEVSYKIGLESFYQVTRNFNAHFTFFYNQLNATDYLRQNKFTQISYAFKFGPEYAIPLFKSKFKPKLVFMTELGILNYRSSGTYNTTHPYYGGSILYAFDRPLQHCLMYDFGLGLQAQYKRFRFKVQGIVIPVGQWKKYYKDNFDVSGGVYSTARAAGYGSANNTLWGNVFVYFTFGARK